MTSSGGGSIPDEMWDVVLADHLSTTPWDVRENATVWDVMRVKDWIAGKNAQIKVQEQRQRARTSTQATHTPRRGRRR